MSVGQEDMMSRLQPLALPCSDKNWARIQNYLEYLRTASAYSISDYWQERERDFQFSRLSDGAVVLAGYFTAPSTKPDVRDDSAADAEVTLLGAARHLKSKVRDSRLFSRAARKRAALHGLYEDTYRPLLDRMYPGLTSALNVYNSAKNANVALHLLDLLRGRNSKKIVEIGAGGGVLALLLTGLDPQIKYHIIDLGPVIPTAFLMMSHFNPALRIRLPNENFPDPNVTFSLPHMIEIDSSSVDAVVNVASFQEMNQSIVETYFKLMERVLAPGGLFLCANRIAKETVFEAYPWPASGFKTVVDEEDATSRYSGDSIVVWRRIIQRSSEPHRKPV